MNTIIQSIREKIRWEFEKKLFNSCIDALSNLSAEIRYNTFAFSFRELIRHIFSELALDEEVVKCLWYKNETQKKNGVTRKQRMLYAIKGGLSDKFVEEELNIDLKEISKKIIKVIDSLNKYTHIEEETFNVDSQTGDEMVKHCLSALNEFLIIIEDVKQEIVYTYEKRLYSIIDNAMISDVIQELDELSTHYFIEGITIYSISINTIDSAEISISINGSVEVEHQYGSDRDNRNGDGLIYSSDYPFEILTSIDVEDPFDINISTEEISVDNSKFYE